MVETLISVKAQKLKTIFQGALRVKYCEYQTQLEKVLKQGVNQNLFVFFSGVVHANTF